MKIVYGRQGASKSQPNTTYIANTYIPKIKSSNPDVVIIDIEAWKLTTTSTSTEVSAFIAKFKKVISVFRSKMPNTKIGVYLWVPERNWLAPCGDPGKRASRTVSWHKRNLRLQPLADAVDIIVPSLYTFYGDSASIACWPNLREGEHCGSAHLWKAGLGVSLDEVSHRPQTSGFRPPSGATAGDRLFSRRRRRALEQARRRSLEFDRALVGPDQGLPQRSEISTSCYGRAPSKVGGAHLAIRATDAA